MFVKRSWIISVVIILILSFNAEAALYNTNGVINTPEGVAWCSTYSAEAKANRILSGNYAFVDGKTAFWDADKVSVLTSEAYYSENDGEFYIPSDFANEKFGLNCTAKYIAAGDVCSRTGLDKFYDPRGFCILSKTMSSSINTESVSENSGGYYDFYNVSHAIGTILWNSISPTDAEYEAYVDRWEKLMTTPDAAYDSNAYTAALKKTADDYIKKIVRVSDNKCRFSDLAIKNVNNKNDATNAGLFNTAYSRLFAVARYYVLMGKADAETEKIILDTLNYLYYYYSQPLPLNASQGRSWPCYAFNIPFNYSNILCLMRDSMSDEQIAMHANATFDRAPDPVVWRGSKNTQNLITNLSWACVPFINASVLIKDTYRVNYGFRYLNGAFMYNIANYEDLELPPEGYYEDGSFMFHSETPYAMGYGISNLENIATLLLLTKDTVFDVRNVPYYDNIYTFIEKTYLPFIIQNLRSKSVSGRWDPRAGTEPLSYCMIIADAAETGIKEDLYAKINKKVAGYESIYNNILDSRILSGLTVNYYMNQYRNHSSTVKADESGSSNVFYNMDRAVYDRGNYAAVLSMYSARTSKYESFGTADSGGSDWYINSGALYVYNGNNGNDRQYNLTWAGNVNKYMIPGTTVDSTVRGYGDPDKGSNSWAGGASNGEEMVAGMVLSNEKVSDLQGKKSYFFLGNRIVCIGSDIFGGNGDVYTTIDNRYYNMQ